MVSSTKSAAWALRSDRSTPIFSTNQLFLEFQLCPALARVYHPQPIEIPPHHGWYQKLSHNGDRTDSGIQQTRISRSDAYYRHLQTSA